MGYFVKETMNFADEFELPVTITLGDKDQKLVKLSGRDYLPWCADLQKEFLEKNLARIEESTADEESKLQMRINAHAREVTPDDCQSRVGTLAGSERVIINSITKSITGKAYDRFKDDADVKSAWAEADSFLESLDWESKKCLAIRLCGLFPRELEYQLLGIPAKKKFAEAMEKERIEKEKTSLPTIGQSAA